MSDVNENLKSAEEWNSRLRKMLTEQKERYEADLTALRSQLEVAKHAETIESLRDPQVAGIVCPACFTRLFCHCSNCKERNIDKTPYLWRPDGMREYCTACQFTFDVDLLDDIEYHRMKFVGAWEKAA